MHKVVAALQFFICQARVFTAKQQRHRGAGCSTHRLSGTPARINRRPRYRPMACAGTHHQCAIGQRLLERTHHVCTLQQIGGARGALGEVTFFNGLIDEVRLYQRTLTDDEIYDLYLPLAPSRRVHGDVSLHFAADKTVSGVLDDIGR